MSEHPSDFNDKMSAHWKRYQRRKRMVESRRRGHFLLRLSIVLCVIGVLIAFLSEGLPLASVGLVFTIAGIVCSSLGGRKVDESIKLRQEIWNDEFCQDR